MHPRLARIHTPQSGLVPIRRIVVLDPNQVTNLQIISNHKGFNGHQSGTRATNNPTSSSVRSHTPNAENPGGAWVFLE